MIKESRQIKRAKERQSKKTYWDNPRLINLELYYITMERKSMAGVVYKYFKKIIDIAGLRNKNYDESGEQNIVDKGESTS